MEGDVPTYVHVYIHYMRAGTSTVTHQQQGPGAALYSPVASVFGSPRF